MFATTIAILALTLLQVPLKPAEPAAPVKAPADEVPGPLRRRDGPFQAGLEQTTTLRATDFVDRPVQGRLAGAGVSQEDPPTSLAQDGPERPVDYYVKNRGYRTSPEPDPVRYVRTLSTGPIQDFKGITWLDVGFEHRTRFESRDSDFRRTPQTGRDEVWLLRTRAFAGVKDVLDPLRAVAEFQDSRSYHSDYPSDNRDVNEADFVQIYGELHFKDALGEGRPVVFRAGRQAFEIADRRLIARNEFRNTSNNFQGYRLMLGRRERDWDLDLFAMQPIDRLLDTIDEPFDDQWLYGGVFQWRRWSQIATLQPYYLDFRQTDDSDPDQRLHTIGLRGYGVAGTSGFDWEFSVARQFGRTSADQRTAAFAAAVEAGYAIQDAGWKPRFSLFYGYGSGDKDPADDRNGRFNSLFGFNQPWSRNDYFTWENIHAPKVRAEFVPLPILQIDVGYGAFWLASDTDSWARAGLRDTSGSSGTFLGHEADIRIRYRLAPRVALEASYALFVPGEFPRNLGKDDESHFVYLQFTFSLFERCHDEPGRIE